LLILLREMVQYFKSVWQWSELPASNCFASIVRLFVCFFSLDAIVFELPF
jgi:hypothetical protein